MPKLVGLIACTTIAFGLSGCNTWNTLEAQARIDPRTVALYRGAGGASIPAKTCDPARLRGDAYDVVIDLDCFRFPDTPAGSTAYRQAAVGQTERNRLASVLMKHSDDVCTKELGDLSARESISNTSLGIATSALSTVGSIVTGERFKSWLAGGAGFTNATRDHINAEVFRNVLASAMSKAILSSRDVQRAAIHAKSSSAPAAYDVDQMVTDVNRYHQTCSFYNGLVLVVDAVNRASPSIASEYRDMSGAIAELKASIAEVEQRIAGTTDASLKTALVTQRGQLLEQLTNLQVARSKLSSIVPATTVAPAPAPAPAVQSNPGG